MRSSVWVIAALCLFAGVLQADEKPNPEQLKKAYDDALVQLKAAQNSKNDLAKENDKLAKQLEDIRKQMAVQQGQVDDLKRQVADNDQKTFDLRSYQAAWQAFLRAHPDLLLKWKLFLGEDALSTPQESRPLVNPAWPLFDDRT